MKNKKNTSYLIPHTSYLPSRRRGGFTLLEVLVSLGILVVIGSVVLANNSKFNSEVELTNLTYEVALTVREAQVSGTSVREASAGSGNFEAGYGTFFDMGNPATYIYYVDNNENNKYDGGSELLRAYTIQKGHFIKRLCVKSVGGSENCSDSGSISELNVVFNRPLPNADIRTNIGSGPYDWARIYVGSPSGTERSVLVESAGQVSIQE